MAGLQLVDYGTVKPLSLTDAISQWQQIDANKQQQKLNEMKMAEAEQNAPLERRFNEARALNYEADAALNQQKAHMQRVQFANNIAKQAFAYADKTGLKQGTPEYDQAVRQAAEPFRNAMSQAFGHADTGEPIDVNALRSLASMDAGGAQYHPPVPTSSGYLQYKDGQFVPLTNEKGEIYNPVPADIGLAYNKKGAETAAGMVKIQFPDGSEGYVPAHQANAYFKQFIPKSANKQLPSNVTMDLTNPEDIALAQKDLEQYGATYAPSTEIIKGPSLTEKRRIETEASLSEAKGKNELEMQKAKQERVESVGKMLNLISNPVGEDGQTIEDLIKKSTGSYLGKGRDIAAATIGLSTEGANALAELRPIHEWLTSLVPRMQGPQSNFDVARYEAMAGDIANPDIPSERRLKSFKSLVKMLENYQKTGGEVTPSQVPDKPAQSSDDDIHFKADAILRGSK